MGRGQATSGGVELVARSSPVVEKSANPFEELETRGVDTALQDRLLAKRHMDPLTGCWEWTGALDSRTGVGRISVNNRSTKVPRAALLAWKGLDLTADQFVLHSCENPACFNPEHLIVGDRKARDEKAKAEGRYWSHHDEKHGHAKLTNAQVAEIHLRYAAGGVTQLELAQEYGVSEAHLNKILRGKARRHAA